MYIDPEDFKDDDDTDLELGVDIEELSDYAAVKNYRPFIKNEENQYKALLRNRENRLTCIDFNQNLDELIFYFETVYYHFGKCLIIKEQIMKDHECCLCKSFLKAYSNVYVPAAWDIKLQHFKICKDCFMSAFDKFIEN
jgi:hypothetical protein